MILLLGMHQISWLVHFTLGCTAPTLIVSLHRLYILLLDTCYLEKDLLNVTNDITPPRSPKEWDNCGFFIDSHCAARFFVASCTRGVKGELPL